MQTEVLRFSPWNTAPGAVPRLPESLRGEWFDAIETMGLEPDDENIPKEYLSEEWHGDAEVYA
jgi:hypothetical protein